MLNNILSQLKRYGMTAPGDRVTCAVSGGADSMALLWAMYLLREKLDIRLEAAHFNHNLRGDESRRDEQFVRDFCSRFDIPLTVGSGHITPGKKGLEAAAREARYAFLDALPGKLATAHTADDNAETVLMHLVRGTGLKGLGGIAPVNGCRIRPMLCCTRAQVLAFLQEYHIPHIEDSSNQGDAYLRNRLRHHVMPLLTAENPRLAENLSAAAQRLRWDEEALAALSRYDRLPDVPALKAMPKALRCRVLETFLKESGVKEPESEHIALAEALVFSEKPSARAAFPGGVILCRSYDRLERFPSDAEPEVIELPENGCVYLPQLGLRVTCQPAQAIVNTPTVFTVCPQGKLLLRCRRSGDTLRLPGGTKSVKKLFIDKKIPAHRRLQIPIVADSRGILGIWSIGADTERMAADLPALQIRFETADSSQTL